MKYLQLHTRLRDRCLFLLMTKQHGLTCHKPGLNSLHSHLLLLLDPYLELKFELMKNGSQHYASLKYSNVIVDSEIARMTRVWRDTS